MAEADDTDYRDPFGVTYDDEKDHVRVMVVIMGLKKAPFKNEPKGGKVDFKAKERSFTLIISTTSKDTGTKKEVKYRYHIRKLPGDIVPSKSDVKVQDGKVLLKIYKAKLESWEAILSDVGLDTFEEDEEETNENKGGS